jgi:hypothetical protein
MSKITVRIMKRGVRKLVTGKGIGRR